METAAALLLLLPNICLLLETVLLLAMVLGALFQLAILAADLLSLVMDMARLLLAALRIACRFFLLRMPCLILETMIICANDASITECLIFFSAPGLRPRLLQSCPQTIQLPKSLQMLLPCDILCALDSNTSPCIRFA